MKKTTILLISLILQLAILTTVCFGCGYAQAETKKSDRFTCEEYIKSSDKVVSVITDTETGVQYLLVDVPYGGCMVMLQPAQTEKEE